MLGQSMQSLSKSQGPLLQALRDKGVAMDEIKAQVEPSESADALKPKSKRRGAVGALKAIKKLNRQAQSTQTTFSTLPQLENAHALTACANQALALFAQALHQAQPFLADGNADFEYDHCFALQGKLWCINELIGLQADQWTPAQAIALAQEILALNARTFSMHYSELGELQRSASVLANNTLAWYLLQSGELAQALTHANAAIADIQYANDDAASARVLENKVRIQLAMGESDAAYATTYQLLREHPQASANAHEQHIYRYFYVLQQSDEYKRWDIEN
jgi:tetratricopeptide (TPR) repeat protein